jgi:drug/metabolite transporter (DMT)-like permease
MCLRGAERFSRAKIGSVFLALAGLALVIGIFERGLRLDGVGVMAALIAAFSFAYYNIGGHLLLIQYDRWTVLLYTTLAASLFWLLANPPMKIVSAHYSSAVWVFLVVFSWISVLVPFTFYFAGLKRLRPTEAIIASCLEPVFSILIAAIALQEVIRPLQALGVVMVLGAIVLVQRSARDRVEPIPGPVD